MAARSLEEILDKIRSPKLQNQHQTASILQAIELTLEDQDAVRSPTAYLAALLGLLARSQKSADGGERATEALTIPVVYLLDIVAPFTPQPVLRAKFTQILELFAPQLLRDDANAPLLKPCIGCLESLLLAQGSTSWELSTAQIGPRRAVAGLLNLSLDHRPKVRKRALEALRKVLGSPPPSPSLDHPASSMCAETAMTSLRKLAENAAQLHKDKGGNKPTHDPSLIHSLQLARAIAASSGGWPSKRIEPLCELLLSIARTGNEHLVTAVFDIFEMIFEGMAGAPTSAKLPRLLEILAELRPAQNDVQILPPWVAILSRGYDVSSQIEPDETFYRLPAIFDMVAQFLQSTAQNIRISASECLASFLANCVPDRVLVEVSDYDERVIAKLVKTAEGLLDLRYQAAWSETLGVLGALCDALRWRANPYLLGIIQAVGEIRGKESPAGKKGADEVIGKAIRAIGPAAILAILPLNLALPSEGQPGRAWLLPLLRDYVANTDLAHFKSELLPLSGIMFQRVLDHGAAAKTMEVKIYETVVQQIWSILPGYCDCPLDLMDAFDQPFAELLANLLYEQVDLRLDVCRALQTLVDSNQTIASIEAEEDDLIVQSRMPRERARQNLAYLSTLAGNLLAVLFNVYGQSSLQSRGGILRTINAYLSITPKPALKEIFDRVRQHLGDSLQDAATPIQAKEAQPLSTPASETTTSHTLADLAITMSVHLPEECFGALFDVASAIVYKDDDPQLQKKAYKLIPRLAETSVGRTALSKRHIDLQALFANSADKVSAPARRERLAAIAALIPLIPDSSLHFIPTILSEVVISCKEQNERARSTAFDALILMGQRMISASGTLIQNSQVPHMPDDATAAMASLDEYFTMVSAGLAGGTPHMISASITALSRILYEFRDSVGSQILSDLVQTMDLFLTSNSREIVRSVIGFVKVCIIGLPAELMIPRLASLIPNLMVWSHEHKSHFRAKVKHLLDRMIRRFGFDVVNEHCPEADRKLINNIRKTKDRNKRRKVAAKGAGEDDTEGADKRRRHVGRFESEYDEALQSSDDDSEEADDSDREVLGKAGANRRQKAANAYIIERDDEPLDLLDRKTLTNISSTKPTKSHGQPNRRARTNESGKLILGDDVDVDDSAMDVDPRPNEETGVGAYVTALDGRDQPKRGLRGRLRWSNKAGKGDADEELDDNDVGNTGAKAVKATSRDARSKALQRGGARRDSRGGKGSLRPQRRGLGGGKSGGGPVGGRVGKPGGRGRR